MPGRHARDAVAKALGGRRRGGHYDIGTATFALAPWVCLCIALGRHPDRCLRNEPDCESQRGHARVEALWAGSHRRRHLGRITDADILHTGDTFLNGVYPFIDYSTGGNIDGMIRASDANLQFVIDLDFFTRLVYEGI